MWCIKNKDLSRNLKAALEALLGSAATEREHVDKLFAYLDILDRKAASICTVNSLLLAVNGLLIFRPPPSIDTSTHAGLDYWKMHLLLFGAISVALSLATVIYALGVNSMKWPFLHNYQAAPPAGSKPFAIEIQGLCDVIITRTKHVALQGWLTIISIGATILALFFILLHTYHG